LQIHGGEGWRLRIDPERQPFAVLIGGRDWAAEFSAAEARQLQTAVGVLVGQLAAIAPQLMPEETIALEQATAGLWMQLSGTPGSWSLRFVLEHQPGPAVAGRGLEGGWDAAASAALAAALQTLQLPGGDHESRMRQDPGNPADEHC